MSLLLKIVDAMKADMGRHQNLWASLSAKILSDAIGQRVTTHMARRAAEFCKISFRESGPNPAVGVKGREAMAAKHRRIDELTADVESLKEKFDLLLDQVTGIHEMISKLGLMAHSHSTD